MNINKLIFSIAASFIFSLGCAQCPDSVHVYVDPEVICPGEIAHLSTDSLLLHCVNIGDIICVKTYVDGSHDTIIVSPNDWTRLSQDPNLTALSIVFYVDSTCKHGWALQVKDSSYSKQKWNGKPAARELISSLPTLDGDPNSTNLRAHLNGQGNTLIIKNIDSYNSTNYPAVASINEPYYLPAIGQLNLLFCLSAQLNTILDNIDFTKLPTDASWWSSTQHNKNDSWYLKYSDGTINHANKTTSYDVLPVMNF